MEDEDEDEDEDLDDKDLEKFYFFDCIGYKAIFRKKKGSCASRLLL